MIGSKNIIVLVRSHLCASWVSGQTNSLVRSQVTASTDSTTSGNVNDITYGSPAPNASSVTSCWASKNGDLTFTISTPVSVYSITITVVNPIPNSTITAATINSGKMSIVMAVGQSYVNCNGTTPFFNANYESVWNCSNFITKTIYVNSGVNLAICNIAITITDPTWTISSALTSTMDSTMSSSITSTKPSTILSTVPSTIPSNSIPINIKITKGAFRTAKTNYGVIILLLLAALGISLGVQLA